MEPAADLDESLVGGRGIKGFCLKYFCEGQVLDFRTAAKVEQGNLSWYMRNRKLIAMITPSGAAATAVMDLLNSVLDV